MEETVLDFDKWVEHYQPVEADYYAVYNDDGTVTGIYPERVVVDKKNKILIDRETAENIKDGSTQLHLCRVNVLEKKFLVSYEKEIDDVLHRIPDRRWSSEKYFDFYVEYFKKESKLVLALSKKYLGTRDSDTTTVVPFNNFDTEIHLIFSEYNDPNMPYYNIRIKVEDLMKSEKEVENIILPERFSVFTRRFFDTYIVDVK
jgi:hypothetical protein